MVTVTYRQLEPMDTDYPGVTTRIEAYTGARQVYGLDTPIDVLDIIDNVGVDDGILTLQYAASDTLLLCQTLALECLRGNMEPWIAAFPGDSRLSSFLTNAELYLATKDTPGTPKTDYCGDDIPGFYGSIPVNQVTEEYNSIRVSSDALSLTRDFYVHSFWMTNGAPFTPAEIAYWQDTWVGGRWTIDSRDQNSTDPATITATALAGYTTQNISAALATDPDYYFKESASFDAQTPASAYYAILVHRSLNGSYTTSEFDAQMDYGHLAVQMLADQLNQLITMLVNDIDLLPSIVTGIRGYMLQYETGLRLAYGASLPRLQALANTGAFPNNTYNTATAAAEETIRNAGLNRRAELLRSEAYIDTFDTDLSGTLNSVERVALENAVRAEMVAYRKAAANTLFLAAETEFNALDQLSSGQRIIDIITPYLL